jgi:hypothetical protein
MRIRCEQVGAIGARRIPDPRGFWVRRPIRYAADLVLSGKALPAASRNQPRKMYQGALSYVRPSIGMAIGDADSTPAIASNPDTIKTAMLGARRPMEPSLDCFHRTLTDGGNHALNGATLRGDCRHNGQQCMTHWAKMSGKFFAVGTMIAAPAIDKTKCLDRR